MAARHRPLQQVSRVAIQVYVVSRRNASFNVLRIQGGNVGNLVSLLYGLSLHLDTALVYQFTVVVNLVHVTNPLNPVCCPSQMMHNQLPPSYSVNIVKCAVNVC